MRMKKGSWLNYFVFKNIKLRKGRFFIAISAVMLTVAVLTAFVVLSTGIREKMSRELQSYGANMIVTTLTGLPLKEDVTKRIVSNPLVRGFKAHIYGTLTIRGQELEVIGVRKKDFKGVRLEGSFPEGGNQVIVGVKLAEALGIKKGQSLKEEKRGVTFRVSGIFERGSKADTAIVMDLATAREFFGIKGFSALLLNVDTRYISRFTSELKRDFPSLKITTVKQVALAEEKLLKKIELLMVVVSLVVVFSAAITMGSTVGANIIERMEEIGLMKALGARASEVGRFFLYEAMLSGIIGSLLGTLAGVAIAEAVSRTAFNSFVGVEIFWLPLLICLGVVIAVAATLLPVRRATSMRPSSILRGEG